MGCNKKNQTQMEEKKMSEGRMIKKCPDCMSLNVEEVFDGEAYCKDCHLHCSVFDLEYATVFDCITVSPEVLAEEFVEMIYDRVAGDYRYYSMLTGEFYNSREEAVAATVARLEETANG